VTLNHVVQYSTPSASAQAGEEVGAQEDDRGLPRYALPVDADLQTIVVGYDGTRPAERALARAMQLAHAFGATVIVADVAAPEPPPATSGAFGFPPYYYSSLEEQGIRADEALWKQHRARIQALFAETGVPYEFAGVVGQPAQEIVEVAARRDADLIVVGTREPGLLERLLEGSVSQGVARRARCDVLVVHPAEDDDRDR
jgi:nucleotide-binding universal stress UspA family protein